MTKTSAFVRQNLLLNLLMSAFGGQKIPILLKIDLDVSKNDDFSTIIIDSEIKKAIIAAGPKQPEGPFPKDPLQSGCSFSTNYYHFVAQSGLKLRRYWLCYSSSMNRVYCQLCWLFPHENCSTGTSYAL